MTITQIITISQSEAVHGSWRVLFSATQCAPPASKIHGLRLGQSSNFFTVSATARLVASGAELNQQLEWLGEWLAQTRCHM